MSVEQSTDAQVLASARAVQQQLRGTTLSLETRVLVKEVAHLTALQENSLTVIAALIERLEAHMAAVPRGAA